MTNFMLCIYYYNKKKNKMIKAKKKRKTGKHGFVWNIVLLHVIQQSQFPHLETMFLVRFVQPNPALGRRPAFSRKNFFAGVKEVLEK